MCSRQLPNGIDYKRTNTIFTVYFFAQQFMGEIKEAHHLMFSDGELFTFPYETTLSRTSSM